MPLKMKLAHPQYGLEGVDFPFQSAIFWIWCFISGAGNETRTRDINLGKVALYQLSYSRKQPAAIKQALVLVFHNYKIAKTATITFFSI